MDGVLIVVLPSAIKDEDKVQGKEIVNPHGSAPHQGAFGRELYEHFAEYIERGELKVRLIFTLLRDKIDDSCVMT